MIKIAKVLESADIEIVAAMAHDLWNAHYVPIIGQAQVDYMLERFQSVPAITAQLEEGHHYYLLTDRGEPVGYFAIVPDKSGGTAQLSKIYVREDRRGRGFGKRIIGFVDGYCTDAGIGEIWLTVNRYNADAISFYEGAGFFTTGEMVQEIGDGFVMDDYRMAKNPEDSE